MKRNRLFIFVFVFIVFFSVNIDGVLADTSKECFYKGQLIFNNGSQTGTNYNQTVAVGIKYSCVSKNKCSSEYAASYIDSKNKSNSLNFTNAKDYFGPNKGLEYYSNGQIKCPSYVVVSKNSNKFKFFYECVSGEAASGNCLGTGVKLNKTEVPSGDSLAEKAKKITDEGSYYAPSGDTTPATEPEKKEKKEKGHNIDDVDGIHRASDRWNSDQIFSSEDGSIECITLLGEDNIELIKSALLLMSAVGVIFVIIFGISDFIKSIVSSDDDALLKSWKRLKNRLISIVILLLLPFLVDFLLSFINDNVHYQKVNHDGELEEEISIKVGKVSDCGQ